MSSSPIATTSAILGASSAGWSPQRSPRRQMMSSSDTGDQTPSDFGSEQGSPSRMRVPEHRANLGSLRSHGLVSNSIFKSAGGNSSPQSASNYSPSQSPSRQSPNRMSAASPNSQQRFGVGLGISATPSKSSTSSPSKTISFIRSTSNSSINSNQSNSDAENEGNVVRYTQNSPRKSTNFKRLEKANYVSNSPFRRNGTFENAQADFELPDNAWARSAALSHANRSPNRELQPSRFGTEDQTDASNATIRPQTPERTPERLATAHGQGEVDLCTPTSNGTPRNGRRSIMNASAVDSPSSAKGLLTSNRLHGPRSMLESGSGTDSPMESPTKRERRKTVTFDEVLDVQEFDRESSFDRESMQSASSDSGSLNGAQRHLSFDSDGIQREHSGGSSSDDDAMWLQSDLGAQKVVERLMVVNASPESQSSAFSTPDLMDAPRHQEMQSRAQQQQQQQDALNDASSNDSRELSSIDEPQSPQAGDMSLSHSEDKSYRTAADGTIYHDGPYVEGDSDVSGGNLSAYGALHRVESMVDELLGDELLDGHAKEQQQQQEQFVPHPAMRLQETQQEEDQDGSDNQICDSPPRRRRAAGPKLGEEMKAAKALPHPPAKPTQMQPVPLSLPEWSPLMKEDNTTSTFAPEKPSNRMMAGRATGPSVPTNVAPAQAIQSPRTNGRPHISRDAVLQRVAKEKMLQQEQQERKLDRTPEVGTEKDAEVAKPQKPLTSSSRRSEPERRQSPQMDMTRKEDATQAIQVAAQQVGPTRQVASGEQRSPLERLATELDAEVAAEEQRMRKEQDQSVNESTRSSSSSSLPPIEKASESSAGTSSKQLLDAKVDQDGFESGLRREFSRIYRQGDSKYHVKDRGAFTSLVAPELGRPAAAGQEKRSESNAEQEGAKKESGKAWRKLRRPSDMNEYAKEMREYRAKENPKKVAGKVFVMVDSFTPANLPIPSKPTRFYCVLDNGLHVVRTATAGLRTNGPSKVGQEFELIQHRNLTFNLTLVAQRDSHLQEPSPLPANESSPSSSMKRDRMTPSFSRGVGKLFSSPKKRQASSAASIYATSSNSIADQARSFDPLMTFMNREGAFGQSEVVFEQIAQDCLAQCHIVELPVRAVAEPPAPAPQSTATDMYNAASTPARVPALAAEFSRNFNKIRGTLRLKVFYLPPMPGISKSLLPESLSECIKGMESARWHAGQPWMEGTLTQLGGDCQSWRRRPVKAQGAHLIGFNEITKKPTVKIDLSKAISIEENHDPHKKTGGKAYNDDDEEFDETYHVERSFRITFKDGERIFFFADTDEEMHRWLNALSKIVGNSQIPPQCAWSQLALDMLRAKRTNSNEIRASDRPIHSSTSNAMSKTSLGPSKSHLPQERQTKLSPTREQDE
ncbi:uncharacterized protein FA14DRAFT_162227 [Meira miltonrushii]|uniref:PH domain-containing protein n=1 Tax=Meira miltonrushii TaxID=1280837 RepID=A0A316V6H4_9BASI|nr:uncharacterized protein FA14DRAFT_162227 [Meira miltonrushii]PWN33116.1 hypothetical protein FA14DRAFT_162227 [Meira miltonrushii]